MDPTPRIGAFLSLFTVLSATAVACSAPTSDAPAEAGEDDVTTADSPFSS